MTHDEFEHDSDDSMEESEDVVLQKVDLENRQDNWSAYLETFDEENTESNTAPEGDEDPVHEEEGGKGGEVEQIGGEVEEEVPVEEITGDQGDHGEDQGGKGAVEEDALPDYEEAYPVNDEDLSSLAVDDLKIRHVGSTELDYSEYPQASEYDDDDPIVPLKQRLPSILNALAPSASFVISSYDAIPQMGYSDYYGLTLSTESGEIVQKDEIQQVLHVMPSIVELEKRFLTLIHTKPFNINQIEQMLSTYPDVMKAMDDKGRSPLHLVCMDGCMVVARLLHSHGANIDCQDYDGRTALHLSKDPAIIQYLCQEGARLDIPDIFGTSPLQSFVEQEHVEAVRVLLSFGASPMKQDSKTGRNSIHEAASLGNYSLLMTLILESKVPLVLDQGDEEGYTALHLAASGDRETGEHLKIVMLLLDQKASVNVGNNRGITALHFLCANRMLHHMSMSEPIVELLLYSGADPNARDKDGCTPLIVSVAYREWNVCKMLLEAGGDLNISCSMKSGFLQGGNGMSQPTTPLSSSKDHQDMKTMEAMTTADCTASDLMSKSIRHSLFGSIRVLQTRIPGVTRDRCMNCANFFHQNSGALTAYLTTGRHHCRHCNRVLCQDCSPHEVPRADVPQFVQDAFPEAYIRLCVVCHSVLFDK